MEAIKEESPAQWAIDLLEGKNYFRKEMFYNKYLAELVCCFAVLPTAYFRNIYLKRPPFAGIQLYFATALSGLILGRFIRITSEKYYAKRDAILLDYVKKHPDRFPEPRNRKYADILDPWLPVR